MLQLNMKRIKNQYSPAQMERLIIKKFFQLKTSDILKLKEFSKIQRRKNAETIKKLNESFSRTDSTMALAMYMLRRLHGDSLSPGDVFHSTKYFDAFWSYVNTITEYRNDQKAESLLAKRKNLTKHKKCGILNK